MVKDILKGTLLVLIFLLIIATLVLCIYYLLAKNAIKKNRCMMCKKHVSFDTTYY